MKGTIMTPEIINLIFPNPLPTPAEIEAKYPPRQLPDGAKVTRVAPSPTGDMHIGGIYIGLLNERIAHQSNGIFYLRVEDTDQKRIKEGAMKLICNSLGRYGIYADEGVDKDGHDFGLYGPYTQSQRKEIYQAYVKDFLEKGLAYPCFCAAEDLDIMRKIQEKTGVRPGYYGKYAKCRNLSDDEILANLKAGKPFVIRFKSMGDNNKRMIIKDLIKGELALPENDIDVIIMKGDGLPTYHFAHAIDDHLMRTTHILRGEEWISSTPVHLQLFQVLGFETPKYAHLGVIMKIDEDGTRRKLSKRKDPEAAVSYYHEQGIPVEAVKLYLMTIANSNFEGWWDQNPTLSYKDFKFDFKKMSVSGSLFDLEKLLNISRSYISRMKATQVFEETLKWAREFDVEFANVLEKYRDYTTAILNIEREQKKPRKDYESFSSIKKYIWYMFDEYYVGDLNYDFQKITDKEEIKNILSTYITKYYNDNDDKETWFNKIKELSTELGYCADMKEYKANPDAYKGNVADISTVIRVATTTSSQTPDLYEILRLLGKDRIQTRFDKFM